MPVSFRGLQKGSGFGKKQGFGKKYARRGRFFAKPKGLDLASAETRFTFARRTKQYSSFWKKSGRTKMKSDYNRKV